MRLLPPLVRIGIAYALIVLAVLLVGVVVPTDDGFLALLQILVPHLALASLVLVPLAVVAKARRLALALLAVLAMFGTRFGSDWWSPTALSQVTANPLRVATWNLEAGLRVGPAAVELLVAHPVDIIAVEELTGVVASAIEADPTLAAHYPYHAMFPSEGVSGIGLLSRFPIESTDYQVRPVRLEARIDLPDGQLVVLAAHPFPATIHRFAGVPVGLDPEERNRDLALLRMRVLELDVRDETVLLLGDFNTAPTEPAFARLTGGLHDAHGEVGLGPGWTWRPARFAFLGIGLLRIDLILSTSELQPISTSIDCPPTGDHCLLEASLGGTGP